MFKNMIFVENIFQLYNLQMKPLRFVLDWDTDEKFYFNMLKRHFAEVNDLDTNNDYAMVLAKPYECTYFHRQIPAFDIKYIEDCIRQKSFPDPTKYVIKTSCPFVYKKEEIFNCWYYQRVPWSNLKVFPILNSDCLSNSDSDCTSSTSTSSKSRSVSSNKQRKVPFTYKDDCAIVQYIVEYKLAYYILENNMWQQMKYINKCNVHSWQSIKQRYFKHIKWDLISAPRNYPFLTPEDIKLLIQGLRFCEL